MHRWTPHPSQKQEANMKVLVILAVALLTPAITQGREVSKCELKKELEMAHLPIPLQSAEDILARVVCQVGETTEFNTDFVSIVGDYQSELEEDQQPDRRRGRRVRRAITTDPVTGGNQTTGLATGQTTGNTSQTSSPAPGQTTGNTSQTPSPAPGQMTSQTTAPASGQATIPATGQTTGQTPSPAPGPMTSQTSASGQTPAHTSQAAGQTPGPATGQTSGPATGHTSGPSSGQTSGPATGPMTGQTPGHTGPAAGQTPGPATGQTSGPSSGQTSGPAPGPMTGQTPGPAPGQITGSTPGQTPHPVSGHTSGPTPGPTMVGRRPKFYFGLFQISDLYCDNGIAPYPNYCNMKCSALLDDNIKDDVACFKKMGTFEEHHGVCRTVTALKYFSKCL